MSVKDKCDGRRHNIAKCYVGGRREDNKSFPVSLTIFAKTHSNVSIDISRVLCTMANGKSVQIT